MGLGLGMKIDEHGNAVPGSASERRQRLVRCLVDLRHRFELLKSCQWPVVSCQDYWRLRLGSYWRLDD